jgi:hypothetical protein
LCYLIEFIISRDKRIAHNIGTIYWKTVSGSKEYNTGMFDDTKERGNQTPCLEE